LVRNRIEGVDGRRLREAGEDALERGRNRHCQPRRS
jgi:hypothetical protein